MSIFIDGFALSMYRSFGPDVQKFGPLGKINIIVGQNNSGKSNILLFLKERLKSRIENVKPNRTYQQPILNLTAYEEHQGKSGRAINGVCMTLDGENYRSTIDQWKERFQNNIPGNTVKILCDQLESILRSSALTMGTEAAWFLYEGPGIIWQKQLGELLVEFASQSAQCQILYNAMVHAFNGKISGSGLKVYLPFFLDSLSPIANQIPAIDLIPAHRKIGEAGSDTEGTDLSGTGIIQNLARLQNPTLDKPREREQFETINQFLQTVLGKKSARLEVPHDRSMIIVEVDGKKLPLNSLGTGVHQVIMMAAAATIREKQIICIEEPELHLHPALQRKLIRYLGSETDNQYFITTHSAHLLDTPNAHVFHVRHHDGESLIDPVYTAPGRVAICADLGYRASDLLQANCIIWVEGPTDRIYLRRWIKAMAGDLVEGLHYSIMFYGGRLLKHLSANDQDVNEFISLRRINRYISILIDSDRKSAEDTINETKQRVEEEFNKGSGFAWVTKGREIENYISDKILEESVKAVYTDFAKLAATGQFEHCYHYQKQDGTVVRDVDKVKIAHEVTKNDPDFSVFDLQERMDQLVAFIHAANDDEATIVAR